MNSIMKRRIAVGMLGLAIAGCAQSRSEIPARSKPVGVEPLPTLSDTINRGFGDSAVQRAALPDSTNPNWSGQFIPPGGGPRALPGAGAQAPASPAAPDVRPSPSSPPPGLTEGPANGAGTPASAPESRANPAPAPLLPPVPPAQTVIPEQAAEAGPLTSHAGPSQALPPGPDTAPGGLPPVEEHATGAGGAPVAPAVGTAPQAASAPSETNQSKAPEAAVGDPLLGPNPDLMPALDAPSALPAKSTQKLEATAGPSPKSGPPASLSSSPKPALAQSLPTTPSPAPAPPPAAASSEFSLETAPQLPVDPRPVQGTLTAPAVTPAPAPPQDRAPSTGDGLKSSPSASAVGAPGASSIRTVALEQAPRSDSSVRIASYKPVPSPTELAIDRNWKEAGRSAARVGDEVITLHDLVLSVKEQLKRRPPGRDLTRPELNMVAKGVLAGLIERTLIAQDARRALKNPKQVDRLYEAADKYFHDEELPSMLRLYMADNELQLKQKLTDSGRSLDALKVAYRQEFLAQVYLEQKLSDRRKVELPEMLKYYNEHLHDKEFDRSAEIAWRELLVEKSHYPNPADARRKAEALLNRLAKGEDFAKLARSESEGPSRVREQGGLMQTSPGSYAVEAVNQALASLPLNRVSPILEGPTSLHIVKVESRREAGPASFEEIQDQIRRKIMVEKMTKARMEFIAKLRQNTPISTIFDGTDSDPHAPEDH